MTSKNLTELKLRELLINEHGIRFRPDIEPEKWPINHRKHFENILSLGPIRFDAWKDASNSWKIESQKQAQKVVLNARYCRDHQVNERTWRSEIEPELFKRISQDVMCKHCGSRLWHPEIDPRESSDEYFTRSSTFVRKSCHCPRDGPNAREAGTVKPFAMREESRLQYSAEVQSRLGRKWESPDKVFALHVSGTLKELLQAVSRKDGTAGRTLYDCLAPTLFPKDVRPVVFPFLLGESKSESSCGSFTRINTQMALVIEQSLDIQKRLWRMVRGTYSEWLAGPLVWCLSHHGPTWRLSAGYRPDQWRIKTEITTLWQGLITDLNGAIQLLLILDYISDWARYIHREAIIRQLQILALPSSDEMTDILSSTGLSVGSYHGRRNRDKLSPTSPMPGSRGLLSLFRSASNGPEALDRLALWNSAQDHARSSLKVPTDLFRKYDTGQAVVRDRRLVTSRFVGVYISTTNLDEIVDCIIQKRGSSRVISNILARLEDEIPLYLDRSTLGDIEMIWTGHKQSWQGPESPQDRFHVLFTISHYVASDWCLVREISFLAVSEAAKDLLYEKVRGPHIRYEEERGRQTEPWQREGYMVSPVREGKHLYSLETIKSTIDYFHKASPDSILLACLNRVSVRPSIEISHDERGAEDMEDSLGFTNRSEKCLMTATSPALSRRVVNFLRSRQNASGVGPDSILLIHISSRRDDQSNIQEVDTTVMACEIPFDGPTFAFSEPVESTRQCEEVSRSSKYCIYVTDTVQLTRLTENCIQGNTRIQHCLMTARVSDKSEATVQWNTAHIDIGGHGVSRHLRGFFDNLDEDLGRDRRRSLFSSESRQIVHHCCESNTSDEETVQGEEDSGEESGEDEDYEDIRSSEESTDDEGFVEYEDGEEDPEADYQPSRRG